MSFAYLDIEKKQFRGYRIKTKNLKLCLHFIPQAPDLRPVRKKYEGWVRTALVQIFRNHSFSPETKHTCTPTLIFRHQSA